MVDPTGKYLYVSNNLDALGSISAYTIASNGALTPVTGSPFTTLVNGGPFGLAVHPNGNFLYIAMSGNGTAGTQIVGQKIDTTTGALSPIPGSPFTVGNEPSGVTIDPAGKFLYVTNMMDDTVSAFTIDGTSGALTAIAGSPFSTGPGSAPFLMAVNKSSSLLYVLGANSTSISVFTIASSGALTSARSPEWRWRSQRHCRLAQTIANGRFRFLAGICPALAWLLGDWGEGWSPRSGNQFPPQAKTGYCSGFWRISTGVRQASCQAAAGKSFPLRGNSYPITKI